MYPVLLGGFKFVVVDEFDDVRLIDENELVIVESNMTPEQVDASWGGCDRRVIAWRKYKNDTDSQRLRELENYFKLQSFCEVVDTLRLGFIRNPEFDASLLPLDRQALSPAQPDESDPGK